MRNYYTLKNKLANAPELNGKILIVKKNEKTNQLGFIDAQTDEVLRVSSKVIAEKHYEDGTIHLVTSNTAYDLINLTSLLPTNDEQVEEEESNKPGAHYSIIYKGIKK